MSTLFITDQFDGGNINVIDSSDPKSIRLEIRKDNASDFYQWFYFRVEGEVGQSLSLNIENCADAAYPKGWDNFNVVTSYDRQSWFRTPSCYQNGVLSWDITLQQNGVYFAYFAPYSYERHLDLIAWAENDERVSAETLGQTLDGRSMQLLKVSACKQPEHQVWFTARQHPGETMAEWFIEGLLESLLDQDNPLAVKLLQDTEFYIVPNMNPDGAARGNLRTNASGANLNREWQDPSMQTSPEVFLVREKMMQVGGDIFLDIHGDEAIPYNFLAGAEGAPNFSEQTAKDQNTFKEAFKRISPDFQTKYGYPVDAPGKANLTIATNWLGNHFKALAFTLEMPFKDNDDLPNELTGWSPERSAKLGADILYPISEVLKS